ncbi:MAG: potassium-transporting ATPase subunit KdpC [Lysobacteraceae bacterium]|nr:MAG: potassium-transporting ATPase subunit KdpC [Xanthomonadaceae bacterium]
MQTSSSPPLIARGAWRPALTMAAVALLGCGFLYSASVASLGSLLFPHQAAGSILLRDGKPVASRWVAQPFADARYFHPRPSAANYDPMAAAGSNQSLTNPDLIKTIDAQITAVAAREGIAPSQVPADLATRSGSGLDPHISPAAAQVQVARVADARGLTAAAVAALVERTTEAPLFGLLGQPRVNVVELNLALDALP